MGVIWDSETWMLDVRRVTPSPSQGHLRPLKTSYSSVVSAKVRPLKLNTLNSGLATEPPTEAVNAKMLHVALPRYLFLNKLLEKQWWWLRLNLMGSLEVLTSHHRIPTLTLLCHRTLLLWTTLTRLHIISYTLYTIVYMGVGSMLGSVVLLAGEQMHLTVMSSKYFLH